jgi:hypothetical protein
VVAVAHYGRHTDEPRAFSLVCTGHSFGGGTQQRVLLTLKVDSLHTP